MNHVTDERTDRALDRKLHDWFASTLEELPDGTELPSDIRSDILSRLPVTPQRRRWWPFRWRPFGPGATRSADREESRPEGRPRSMFTPVRVAAGVAILTLTGALAAVSLPTTDRSAPSAAIDPSEFAGFSGTFRAVTCGGGEMTLHDWGYTIDGDLCSDMKLEVGDERLSGTAHAVHNAVNFKGGPTYGVRTLSAEIVNDGGAWEGVGMAFHDPDEDIMRYEFLLSGREGYEGLSAMLSLVSDGLFLEHEAAGVIFPGELPPYPVLEDGQAPAEWTGEIDPAAYTGFGGRVVIGGSQGTGQASLGEFGSQVRDVTFWNMAVESTDPRIAGVQESLVNYDTFGFEGFGRVHTSTDRIVNDDGAWVGTAHGYIHPETGTVRFVNLFKGEGAYEGLSAIRLASLHGLGDTLDSVGVIFPGGFPPYPELPSAE